MKQHRPGSYPDTILQFALREGRVSTYDIAKHYGYIAPSYGYSMVSTALRNLVRAKELVFESREGRRDYFQLPEADRVPLYKDDERAA